MNIVECIERNSRIFVDKIAYTEVKKEGMSGDISHQDLHIQVNKIAAYMEEYEMKDDKVLIMLPSSIEYITSFFGVIKAGLIAVPAYPVTSSHHRERLESMIRDSQASFIITDTRTKEKLEKCFIDLVEKMIIIDAQIFQELGQAEDEGKPNEDKLIDMEDIAYLQYTSGSTSDAKGVIITHRNIISNEGIIRNALSLEENEKIVTWLPFYHDMGLIGNIILTVYLGASCYIINPIDFLQSPFLWLKTVSSIGGTLVSAPNFAYQMCVDEISDQELEELSLASLRNAVNGAEPVRRNTIETFVGRFSARGFTKSSMKPSFGLAENTLLATTYTTGEEYRYQVLDQEKLGEGIVKCALEGVSVVASGHIIEGVDLAIVNPETAEVLKEREIGEILISSDSATQGYWNNQELNRKVFQVDIGGSRYFRTGDLGYLDDEHLYIIGRIKDIIIIRGKNYYPQDIELLAENSCESIKKDSSAAFSITAEDEEKLIIVGEIGKDLRDKRNDDDKTALEKRKEREEIIDFIYRSVIENYGIEPYDIVLIQEKSIPKTSSGKIQRKLCKQEYISGNLRVWERMRNV